MKYRIVINGLGEYAVQHRTGWWESWVFWTDVLWGRKVAARIVRKFPTKTEAENAYKQYLKERQEAKNHVRKDDTWEVVG
jgi:hypothetical protein